MTTVGEWEESLPSSLRLLRQSAHVSQRKAGLHVGIDSRSINLAERGEFVLPQAVVDKLLAFYAQESAPLIVCRACGHLAKAGVPCVHCGHERT